MSRQENSSSRPQGGANTTTPARITRTNQSQVQRLLNNPSPNVDPFPSEEDTSKLTLLPNKVSSLDKNILFQDMDKNKSSTYQSTNSSRANNSTTAPSLNEDKAIGLISNVFLGSTSRFVKGAINNVTTPVKVEEEVQDTNKATPVKFSRSKDIETKARTISMKEPHQEIPQTTDRTPLEATKKIERRQGGNRDLKFADKKEEKIESTPDKAVTVITSARKTETFKVETIKTEVIKTEQVQQQSFPRVYQPIQRQNPYNRSRNVTEQPQNIQKQPPIQKPTETVVQKPKEQPPKINNRLVQSRLQSQIAESKATTVEKQQSAQKAKEQPAKPIVNNRLVQNRLQSQLAESKVSTEKDPPAEKPKEEPPKPLNNRLVQSRLQSQIPPEPKVTEKQVKPTIAINGASESRLVTDISPPEAVAPPKEEIKPKPYSRSFIARKTQTEVSQVNVPTVVITQSVVTQSSVLKNPQQSKIEEKAKSEIKQTLPEQSRAKIVLKKAGCMALIGKRLIRNRLIDSFSILKSHRQADKAKKINECTILCCSMTSITRNKQTNLLRLGLENIKRRFATAYIASLKSYAEDSPVNHRNAALNLLDRLYSSKMRDHFRTLKIFLERFRNKARCVTTFETFLKRKIKNQVAKSFETIKLKHKNIPHLLNQFSNIYNNVNKNKLAIAFCRVAAVKPIINKIQTSPSKQQPQKSRVVSKVEQPPSVVNTSNQALIEKLEKLKKTSATLQSEITTLDSNLQKKKKSIEGQKGSLLEKVTLLKHQNEQVNNEIQIKKHRSGQIKMEMEGIAPKNHRELEEELTEPRQNKLEFLTNIYISNFKNSEETISTEEIINNYSLKAEDSSVLFNEWGSILRNVQLKRLIAAYEGVDPRENKGRANLIGEQALISRLIRSYVKEQYFWQWIHLSAQNG